MMIRKEMDVKELVSSPIFFPQIWKNLCLFSSCKEQRYQPYYGDIEDIEYEDPRSLFHD